MSMIKVSPLMSPPLIEAVHAHVDSAAPSWHGASPENGERSAWQRLIDHHLVELGQNADQFADEGIELPSRDTIQLAIGLAERLRDEELTAPDSMVPDANGGIVFERREKDVCEVFHVWDDGTIEYQCFHGTSLIERRPF